MNTPRWIRASLLPILGGILLMGGLLLGAATVRAESSIPKQLAVPSDPEGNAACLECHAKDLAPMVRDGQQIPVHVDAAAYGNSVHGIISCVRCHAEVTPDHAANPQKPLNLPTGRALRVLKSEGCVKCHAGKYEESYQASFHGAAIANGDNRAATCVDCHGVHNILPSRDAASQVAKANLTQTCGTTGCHVNPPASFAEGKEHVIASDKNSPLGLYIIYKFFMVLILFDTMKDGPVVMFELLRRLQSLRRH